LTEILCLSVFLKFKFLVDTFLPLMSNNLSVELPKVFLPKIVKLPFETVGYNENSFVLLTTSFMDATLPSIDFIAQPKELATGSVISQLFDQ
jgi:hypothetical protein